MSRETQANRRAWDAVAQAHLERYHVERLLDGEPLIGEPLRSEVGDVRGKRLIHLLCHIGSDTLSWALLGAQVTGVDISPEAVRCARQLSRRMGMPAKFIVCDVMELDGREQLTFDIVFASTGVLCWIPDIHRFAAIVRGLLHSGGFFYLHDGHPFRDILAQTEDGRAVVAEDYFDQGAHEYDDFSDYLDPSLVVRAKSYEWHWGLGEVVTALCQAGLRIEFLREFPQNFYYGYDGETQQRERYPCTFSLKASCP